MSSAIVSRPAESFLPGVTPATCRLRPGPHALLMADLPRKPAVPPTDDRVRRDGGKPTDDKRVPDREFEKTVHNAVDHTRDEPGS